MKYDEVEGKVDVLFLQVQGIPGIPCPDEISKWSQRGRDIS